MKTLVYSILINKYNKFFQFWQNKGVDFGDKYEKDKKFAVKKFEGKSATILSTLWKQLYKVRNLLKSKESDPKYWYCEILCYARMFTVNMISIFFLCR